MVDWSYQRHHLFDCRANVSGCCIVERTNNDVWLTVFRSGAFIVDPLNHYFGRRGEIFITGACLTATPIGSGFAQTWQGLFAARFIMGIGIGAKNATVPIYSAEMAPARVRGALVMFWQLWVTAGESASSFSIQVASQPNMWLQRYLPRLLRQCCCQGHWPPFVAPATRISLHPLLHSHGGYLLLS